MTRIKGLDTIRFLAAVFVLFAHINFPLPSIITNSTYAYLIKQFFSCLFNGPAAVIIFFIISGFCIHYPNKQQSSAIPILSFYTKRLIRIGIPAITMVFIYYQLNIKLEAPHYKTLWSIICESMYYLLYPILFYFNKYVKWKYLTSFAYIIALVILQVNTKTIAAGHQSYVSMDLGTWIIGLPCWLLGCWLAENYQHFKLLSTPKIWVWRGFILILFIILRIVKSHVTSVYGSNCYTLNAFAIIACIWLGYEITYYLQHRPCKLLEAAGKWSYSLYLIHPAVYSILYHFNIKSLKYPDLFLTISCFTLAYIFFILIETPSHKIAIYFGTKFIKQ